MSKPNAARIRAYAAVGLLVEEFPAAVSRAGERRPLRVGIADDLLARGIDRRAVRDGLHWYCGSPRYLIVLQEGAVRIGLDGEPAGTVTAEEAAAHAQQRLTERFKPKPSAARPDKAAKPKQRPKPPPKAPPNAKGRCATRLPANGGTLVRRKFGAAPKRSFKI